MDGLSEIAVFVRVVEARGFTRAGKSLALTASGVSRIISRLEARLGARLLERTTRSVGLTPEGAAYYERCSKVLRDLNEANEVLASGRVAARGRLRVDAPSALGRYLIAPAVPRFLAEHPALSLDLSLRDHLIDPIAEGVDVVVRMATLKDSQLVSRKLGALRLVLVASPGYLARRGAPATPEELRDHETIAFVGEGPPVPWRLRRGGREVTLVPEGRLHSNSGDAILGAVLAGFGLAQLLEVHVEPEIARGTLVPLLRDCEAPPRDVHALFTRDKASLPKVRVFLDLLKSLLKPAR